MDAQATVTVVTGAASGMGRAISERLAAKSAPVVAVDRSDELLTWTPAHPSVVPLIADIATEEGNAAMVATATELFGGVDAAVLNAGISVFGSLEAMPLDDIDRLWSINLRGVILGLRAVLPAMRLRGGGAVVATSSIGGLYSDPSMPVYCATKAAVISVVKSVALQVGHEGIRVNAVCPGPIRDTGMSRGLDVDSPSTFAKLADGAALRRWGTADEIAATMEFLLSPDASYITGTTIVVDGGTIAGAVPPRRRS